MTAEKPLPEIYHEWISSAMGEKGFQIPHGMVVDDAGAMTVLALSVPPTQAYLVMIEQWSSRPSEAIFALDRFAKPDQGTTLNDLLAGFHFTRTAAPRPFIIEYQHTPRIVKTIEWDNSFWNAGLTAELNSVLRKHLGISRL